MMLAEAVKSTNSLLGKKFEHFVHDGNVYFLLPDGGVLTLTPHVWDGRELIIAEYADNFEEYRIGRFEDGDNFFLSDYSPEEIASKLIAYEL